MTRSPRRLWLSIFLLAASVFAIGLAWHHWPEAAPQAPAVIDEEVAVTPPPPLVGDPLPPGAIGRLGTTAFRSAEDITSLSFSDDGRTLTTGHRSDEILMNWDVATGRLLCTHTTHWNESTPTVIVERRDGVLFGRDPVTAKPLFEIPAFYFSARG